MTDYMELIDAYAEARHKYGSHTYNTTTADARKAVEEFFSALGAGGVESIRAARAQAPAAVEPVASEVIAGALFDLLGYLTTLPKQNAVTLSGAHDAAPAVEQLEKWAAKRNFSLDEAEVLNWRKHVAPTTKAEPAPTSDGWLQDGDLLYRLTDDPRPYNRDEIKVTMADGSRTTESRTRRAGELLDMIRSPKESPADALDVKRLDFLEGRKYRDVRDAGWSATYSVHLPAMAAGPWQAFHGGEYDHQTLRAAIDAAMAAQGAKP